HTIPASYTSAAAKAREVALEPGDRVVETSNPDDPEAMLKMPPPAAGTDYDFREFNRRLELLAGKPMKISVRRQGAAADPGPETTNFPDPGLNSDDRIAAPPDPAATPFNPHRVKPLAKDPGDPEQHDYDYADFNRRTKLLAGQPMIVQVQRHGAADNAA